MTAAPSGYVRQNPGSILPQCSGGRGKESQGRGKAAGGSRDPDVQAGDRVSLTELDADVRGSPGASKAGNEV